jgi:hypothetical protein
MTARAAHCQRDRADGLARAAPGGHARATTSASEDPATTSASATTDIEASR